MMSVTGIELSLLGITQFLTLGIGSSFSVEWPPSLCVNFFFQLWRDYRIISNPELFLRSGENCKDI